MAKNKIIRREKIINVAANLFFEKGFSSTSIDDIIKVTGGSKRDIYNEFGNKSGLLSMIIEIYTNKVLHEIGLEKLDVNNIELSLKKFGYALAQSYMKPEILGLNTLIFNEAKRFPNLALEFYEKGPMLGALKLSKFLEKCINQDKLKKNPHDKLAGFFIGILRDKLYFGVILNSSEPVDFEEVKKDVDLAVEIFLNGIKK